VEKHLRHDDAPRTAVLVRHRLVDLDTVSRSGCSFKALDPLSVGDVGLLSVNVAGQVHVQLFRVARATGVADANSLYEAGVEFLPTPASAPSLHDLAAELDRSQAF
jgi:hypothetical protein